MELCKGDFIEVFNPKLNIWVLCEIVTNYGMVSRDSDGFRGGYQLKIIKEDLEQKIAEAYHIHEGEWVLTEDIGRKWWREAPPAAKVLYGGK